MAGWTMHAAEWRAVADVIDTDPFSEEELLSLRIRDALASSDDRELVRITLDSDEIVRLAAAVDTLQLRARVG
jgi:hypothetical protein